MPVGTALTYTDNQKLDTDGHNKNVYDADNNTGIMSESNGGLGASNLDTDFVAHAEHIFPETIALGRQESMTDAVQCFSDVFGSRLSDTTTVTSSSAHRKLIKPISGCGIRVYFPYDASAVLWQWSFFVNPQMWMCLAGRTDSSDPEYVPDITFNAFTAIKRDGVLLESTIRGLPPSIFYEARAHTSPDTGYITSRVARASMWRDMHYLDTNSTYLTKGWHDIQLCLHIEDPRISSTIEDANEGGKIFEDDNHIHVTLTRASAAETNPALMADAAVFGIRNARALVLY